jgi:RND family efflux transporter MFP subunit
MGYRTEVSAMTCDDEHTPGRSLPMNAAPGSPERAPFFRRFLTVCRKVTASIVILALVTAVAGAGRSWLAGRIRSSEAAPGAPAPATVRVVSLLPEVVASALHYSAAVKELEKAELSFRQGGTVESLLQVTGPDGQMHRVHEGDRVPRGSVLARLDPADYRRDRDEAAETLAKGEAQLAKDDASSELARNNLRRAEDLASSGGISKEEVDSRRQTVKMSEAAVAGDRRDVESTRIKLQQAEANLAYCTLTSPFAEGTVGARYVDLGQRVSASQKVFLLLDLSRVVIAFAVPDTVVGRLALGQPVEITCDALPAERLRGVMHKIGSVADSQTRTFAVEVRIDDPRGLRPGMIATVWLRREVRVCLLPLSAVVPRRETGRYDVFRVVEEGGQSLVRRTPVEFDDVVDNRVAVRLTAGLGLKPGDRVVATGTQRLYDGQPVHVEE